MPRHTPEEARETLDAIASGAIDAVVVDGPNGPQVFRLEGPDQPFRAFVERMKEGALTLTLDGTILYANTYFTELLGLRLEDILHQPFANVVGAGYRSTVNALIREGIETTVKGDCRLQSKTGPIPVHITLSPLATGSRPTCCCVVFDLRELEEAQIARAAAEEASAAKDQFLAMLSHELRSPLNTILGWSQILLADRALGDNVRRAVQTIERNARTQAELIADLLDISRITAGKLNLEMSNIELSALAEATLSALRPQVEQKGIRLELALREDSDVYGDPTRLQQIITNLVNNALKFTEQGGTIAVTLRHDDGDVVLEVRDTGIGMSPDLVLRVFDVFQQGGSSQRRKGGLGLGLAIARQLAEAHGGTLVASSDGEGKGSTFTVRLPRVNTSMRPAPARFQPRDELKGITALVVDDDKDNLELARFLLESAGCVVETAFSAENALALLAEDRTKFGLLVSDIGLPGQDGLELMREVRARGFDATQLPSIALTGFAGSHDARLVSAAGYQRHLAKPVDAQSFVRAAAELGRVRAS